MRHGKKFNHLGRKSAHRKAMLANMACSLIEHKRITTTLAKAKALQKYVEPIVTKSKSDSTHSRRIVFRYLQNKEAVTELFREVAPKIVERPGGYTRIIKLAPRLGDNADMAFIELVDFNELMQKESSTKKTKSRRSRRGGGNKKAETTAAETTEEVKEVEEAKVEETKAEATEAKVEETAEAKVEETPEAKVEETAEAKAEEPAVEEKPESAEESKQDDKEDSSEDEKKDA